MTDIVPEKKSRIDEFTFVALKHSLQNKGKLNFRVPTGSMVPVIPINSEIEVVPLQRKPSMFDIIVFWNGEILVCHYVLHVNSLPSPKGEELFITSGLNSGVDWPVAESNVLGIVNNTAISNFSKFKIVVTRWIRKKFLKS